LGGIGLARKANATKTGIIQVANRLFLENGYTNTSVKAICQRLDISTGNLTFHFPTKEHMLAVLVRLLCDFQWDMMLSESQQEDALGAICMELIAMAAICEQNELVKDFYLTAYTSPMTLDIIRKSDVARSKIVYGKYCPDWPHDRFVEVETLVSGIEYAMLMTTPYSLGLNDRIRGALDAIMMLYQIPADIRQETLEKSMSVDYDSLGRQIFSGFIQYVDGMDDRTLEQFITT
jgi:AcrR family transcriptional regulator